jgi:hypothetical protein
MHNQVDAKLTGADNMFYCRSTHRVMIMSRSGSIEMFKCKTPVLPGFYRIEAIVVICLMSLLSSPSATAFTISGNEKCAPPHIIGRMPGRYAPTTGPQEVIISEKQESPAYNQTYCLVDIRLYRWIPQGIFVNTAEFEMSGPGLVFSDGYWHPYPGEIDDKIQKVRLLPPGDYVPKNTFVGVGEYGSDQLLTYNHMRSFVSEFSHLNVTGFWTPRSTGGSVIYVENLLNVCAKSTMKWSVKDNTIKIDTFGGSIALRYDPIAQQMAIVDPNIRTIALYHRLTCSSLPTVILP